MIKSSPIRLLTDECNFDLKNRGQIWETQPIRICLMMMMKRKMSVIIENLQGSSSKLGNIYTKRNIVCILDLVISWSSCFLQNFSLSNKLNDTAEKRYLTPIVEKKKTFDAAPC